MEEGNWRAELPGGTGSLGWGNGGERRGKRVREISEKTSRGPRTKNSGRAELGATEEWNERGRQIRNEAGQTVAELLGGVGGRTAGNGPEAGTGKAERGCGRGSLNRKQN